MDSLRRIGDGHHTNESPNYQWKSPELWKAAAFATVLIVLNVGLMPLFVDSAISNGMLALYQFSIFIGAIVVGGAITLARVLGSIGLKNDNLGLGLVGVAIAQITFGVFGGLILQMYPSSLHIKALLVTAAIVGAITILISLYMYTREVNFRNYGKYSLYCFGGGVVLLLLTDILGGIFRMLAFGIILMGWLFDLAWEIGMSASNRRTPLANGLAIYVAFMGVFVHVLQLVLEAMAEN